MTRHSKPKVGHEAREELRRQDTHGERSGQLTGHIDPALDEARREAKRYTHILQNLRPEPGEESVDELPQNLRGRKLG